MSSTSLGIILEDALDSDIYGGIDATSCRTTTSSPIANSICPRNSSAPSPKSSSPLLREKITP